VILPLDSFHLVMFLGLDTASLKIKYSASNLAVEYLQKSALLVLDTECAIPDPASLSWIQIRSQDAAQVRELVERAHYAYPEAKPCILDAGFYPCMPSPSIGRRAIGRHQVVNQTPRGYLLCFRVPPETKATFDKWASECTQRMARMN
jgi:hypothetical protein